MHAIDLADLLITLGHQKHQPINHLKLQKMMYFENVLWMLNHHGNALVDDDFTNLIYGPVNQDVYHEYANFGKDLIEQPVNHLTDITDDGLVFSEFDLKNIDPNIVDFIQNHWGILNQFTDFELVQFAQQEPQWQANYRKQNRIDQNLVYHWYKKTQHQFWLNYQP